MTPEISSTVPARPCGIIPTLALIRSSVVVRRYIQGLPLLNVVDKAKGY